MNDKICSYCGRKHKLWCGRCFEPILKSANYYHASHPNPLWRKRSENYGAFCWGDERTPHHPDALTLAEFNPWRFRG